MRRDSEARVHVCRARKARVPQMKQMLPLLLLGALAVTVSVAPTPPAPGTATLVIAAAEDLIWAPESVFRPRKRMSSYFRLKWGVQIPYIFHEN